MEVTFDLLFLTVVVSTFNGLVVWRVYEEELLEQREAAATLLAGAIGSTVADLPPGAFSDPEVGDSRLRLILAPLVGPGQALETAVFYGAGGMPLLTLGQAPEVAALVSDDALKMALYQNERVVTRERRPGSLLRDVLQVTAPLRTSSGERLAVRLVLPLVEEGRWFTRLQLALLELLLLNVVLLGLMGWILLRRRVVGPLKRLVQVVRQVSAGELTAVAPAEAGGEIGELSATFNQMVRAVGTYQQEVQRQVDSLERANLQLKAAQEELVISEKLVTVGRLAAGVAHEVGNPLAAIVGYVDLLLLDITDPEQRDILIRVRSEVERIDGIIREMLDLARPPDDGDNQTRLYPLLATLIDFMRMQPRLREVQVDLNLPPGLPDVRAGEQRLRQVLINLILNAADAVQGRGFLHITAELVDASRPRPAPELPTTSPLGQPLRGRFVVLSLADNGVGISPEDLRRIFDPFFSTKQPGAGTGLGLSVSVHLVEVMGGHLEISSVLGQGTTAHVWLPAAEGV